MSTTRSSKGTREAPAGCPTGTAAPTVARPGGKGSRLRHTPGGVGLGRDAGPEAQRAAAAILEVLAGLRTPGQAAEALGVSQARYFQLETRAMQALVASCAARPRGPGRNLERELAALRRQHERLQRELSRHQTLVRLAQRNIGLAPHRTNTDKSGGKEKGKDKGKKRSRRPVVRALRAAEVLQQRSQETRSPEAATPESADQQRQSQEAAGVAATPQTPREP